jgi:CRISPR-associated protein Csb1
MSEVTIDQFDSWLEEDGPAALVFHRTLLPVEGKDAWIFPPTFAQSEPADDDEEGSGSSYQIDELPANPSRNVCLIDSVGSQANRMEPVFKQEPYSALVPRRVVTMKNGDEVNLLDVGHRAADAAVRFSKNLGPKLWAAFDEIKKHGDCSALAKLAPTSLVFGVWDSRATGVKIQRIVRSVIRAYDVTEGKRSATYQAAYDYTGNGEISLDHDKGSGKTNRLSQEGFKYSLATRTHGGVLVRGEIRQEAIINLVALRTLTPGINLKRYLLGLALVALSYRDQQCFNLREGCLLCAASTADYEGKWKSVNFDGTDGSAAIDHALALAYATAARRDIVFEASEPNEFDRVTAEAWLDIDKKERKNLAKTMHPTEALARKRKKLADENAKDPVDAALKTLKTIKLGARPKQGKEAKIQTDKFETLKKIFEPLIDDVSAQEPLKTMASEVIALIQEDKDSHALLDELTKRLQDFKGAQSGEPNDESTITTEAETGR